MQVLLEGHIVSSVFLPVDHSQPPGTLCILGQACQQSNKPAHHSQMPSFINF
jgi:hypothetical protein